MKTVCVIGGTGFIGRNLCEKLIKSGYETVSYSRNGVPSEDHVSGVTYLQGDFFDGNNLSLSGIADIFIHCVSGLSPANSNLKYMECYQKEFIKTIEFAGYLAERGKKMIFISSGGTVYGEQTIFPISENALPHPINHYGNLKLCIENTLLTMCKQTGLNIIVARVANPYGRYQDSSHGVGFIDATLKAMLNQSVLTVYGDGTTIRDYIYIDDVCDAIVKLITYNGCHRVFNIGSGKGTSQNEIINIVNRLGQSVKVEFQKRRIVDAKWIILDTSRIASVIDYHPLELSEGIITYYRFLYKRI